MKAVVIKHFGALTSLCVEERDKPQVSDNDALIEVKASSINPSDVKNVHGAMEGTTLPRIPGRDFAGTVVAGKKGLIGMHVWGTGGDIGFTVDGSHAQYILIPAAACVAKPTNLTFEQAATIGVPYVTAFQSLYQGGDIRKGKSVMIIGASGGVGTAAIQLARAEGCHVIAAVRKETDFDSVRELGAQRAVSTEATSFVDQVLRYTDGKGVDVVIDTVGGATIELCMNAIAHRGRLVEITAPGDGCVTFNMRKFYHRELSIIGVDSRKLTVIDSSRILETMLPMFESNKLVAAGTPNCMPLNEAIAAYQQAETGGRQRIVLVPSV
jgi:NADPH:quinone reductase-like Zn-dependent oxidoreductase